MQYLERSPSPHLAAYVKCYWSLTHEELRRNEPPEPVLPDGCLEIVFNLADRFLRHHTNGTVEVQPTTIIAGQMNQFVEIGPSGRVRLFGIRFWPAGAHPFFRFPLLELNNRIDDLRDVWDSDVNLVQEQLAEATSFDEGIAIVETALTERLRPSPSDDIAIQVARLISSTAGMARIELIRKSFGISERSLERRFKTAIGTSPKMFSRIIRFQNLLKTLEQQKPESFLDIALSLGYYDQPHMIREFKEFSGKSPIAFLKTTHQISEFFTQTS